jgi:hypothetical protein
VTSRHALDDGKSQQSQRLVAYGSDKECTDSSAIDCKSLERRKRAPRVGLRGWRNRTYSTADRLWARTDKTSSPHGCWIVAGYAATRSGHIQINRKSQGLPVIRAHRLAWELLRGPIPDGLQVLHNCPGGDNPRCVNPDHLFLGSNADNIADSLAKGRFTAWRQTGVRLNGQPVKRHSTTSSSISHRQSTTNS